MERSGLLGNILGGTPMANLGITPQILQNEIVIEMTQDQLKSMLLQNADAKAKGSVAVELHEGKLVLKIKLM